MSFATTPWAPERQAALTLHALRDADRSWVLEALPPPQRQQLQLLLEELRNLGIPGDGTLAAELATGAVPSTSPRDWLQDMDAAGVAALASILRRQPLEFTRAVVALVPGPGSGSIARELDPRSGDAMQPALPLAPALERAIRSALEPQWRKALAGGERAKPPTGWNAWTARFLRARSGG